jgi:hypothetical protein
LVAPLTAAHDSIAELLVILAVVRPVGAAQDAAIVEKFTLDEYAEQLAFTCQL